MDCVCVCVCLCVSYWASKLTQRLDLKGGFNGSEMRILISLALNATFIEAFAHAFTATKASYTSSLRPHTT